MTRSLWKGPVLNVKYSRNSIIIPQFVGKVFDIHNGNKFVKITISEEMVGHKFGEFSFTRKKTIHKKHRV